MRKLKKKRHLESIFDVKEKFYTYYYKRFKSLEKLKIERNPSNFWIIRASEGCLLEKGPIKACLRAIKTILRKNELSKKSKLISCFIPDFVLTSKPKEVRMGKGKGKPNRKVALIKKGSILFKISNLNYYVANTIEKQCSYRMPIGIKLIKSNW